MSVIFNPWRILLRKQIEEYSSHIKGRVLDVGAGSFSRYQDLFKCSEYIKMDAEKSENIDIVGDAENLPFKSQSFESVVCTQVFEHLKNPQKAADEIARVLKKGGVCLLSVPQVNELHGEPDDYFRFTKFGLKEILSRAGLEVYKCNQIGGFFTLRAQLKIRYLINRFNIHQKKWSFVLRPLIRFYGKFMLFLDELDKSKANRKHTIGWCVLARKK